MKISMPILILLGAALAVGCAAPALAAQPSPAAPAFQERHEAYNDGYAHGQGDARANAARNDHPTAQWETDVDRAAYRDGYNAGYDEVRNATGPAASGMGYARPEQARQFGYDDGLAAGQQDRNKGNKFNPSNHDFYKNANHGWDAQQGTKYDYSQLYRESFMKGYEAGYRGE